jgi:hypothetical protein
MARPCAPETLFRFFEVPIPLGDHAQAMGEPVLAVLQVV